MKNRILMAGILLLLVITSVSTSYAQGRRGGDRGGYNQGGHHDRSGYRCNRRPQNFCGNYSPRYGGGYGYRRRPVIAVVAPVFPRIYVRPHYYAGRGYGGRGYGRGYYR